MNNEAGNLQVHMEKFSMEVGNAFFGDRDIYLFGAGRVGKDLLQNFNRRHWPVTAFLDSNSALHGKTVSGVPVLDPAAFLSDPPENSLVIISARSPRCEEMDLLCRNAGLIAGVNYLPYHPLLEDGALEYFFMPKATGGNVKNTGGESDAVCSRKEKTGADEWFRRLETRLQRVEGALQRTEAALQSLQSGMVSCNLTAAANPQFTEIKRMLYGSVISGLCNDFSGIDEERETFIVFVSFFPTLSHFIPILRRASAAGIQVIILFSPLAGNFCDKEAHKIFSLNYKVIFLHPYRMLYENMTQRADFSLPFYYLLHKCNVKAVFTDDIFFMPISGFRDGMPYDPNLVPPIYAFKHNIDSSRWSFTSPLLNGLTPFLKYCRKYFVWGEIYKKELQDVIDWEIREGKIDEALRREGDKIFCGGWVRMDSLKNLKTTESRSVFIVGSAIPESIPPSFEEVITRLLEETDYTIYAKRHPADSSNFNAVRNLAGDRFIIMNDNEDYLPVLAACDFSISRISSIMLESLALHKPHIVLYSTPEQHTDSFYDPLREFLFYDNRERLDISGILGMVAFQKENWEKVDEALSFYLSNRFTASEHIFQTILDDSKAFIPFAKRAAKEMQA